MSIFKYKYGQYSSDQISATKQIIRKQIYFLLLYVDPKTKDRYINTDVIKAFNCIQTKLGGLNSLLREQPVLVNVMSLLEAALIEYQKFNDTDSEKNLFDFNKYRKLILDAGNEILKLEDSNLSDEDIQTIKSIMIYKEV